MTRRGGGGDGSILGSLARRRRGLAASRQSLGLGGGGERGAPQATRGTVAPPPQAPAAADSPTRRGGTPAGGGDRQEMLDKIQGALDGLGQQNSVAAPREEAVEPQAPVASTEMLTDRINRFGARGLSDSAQFYRIAGRLPTPREQSVFRARVMLENQLGRPPTTNEMKAAVMRPQTIGPHVQPVVEA